MVGKRFTRAAGTTFIAAGLLALAVPSAASADEKYDLPAVGQLCRAMFGTGDKACWAPAQDVSLKLEVCNTAWKDESLGYHVDNANGDRVQEGTWRWDELAWIDLDAGDVFYVEDPHNPFKIANDLCLREVRWF